jgi:hypothetical protein
MAFSQQEATPGGLAGQPASARARFNRAIDPGQIATIRAPRRRDPAG